ncbi:hypothetical protein PUN28_002037 [Cardiocondyla obscurior]|uniref:CASP-like protein n=1 Tax=Cardiocondyla obscurior TaxID=286306 RepID=A0AAW2GSD6_9HYME
MKDYRASERRENLTDDRWTISPPPPPPSPLSPFFAPFSFLLFTSPFLSLFFYLGSLFGSRHPVISDASRRLRGLFDRATGSCREHQKPPNGNGSCPLDRDNSRDIAARQAGLSLFCFFSTAVVAASIICIYETDRDRGYVFFRYYRFLKSHSSSVLRCPSCSTYVHTVDM